RHRRRHRHRQQRLHPDLRHPDHPRRRCAGLHPGDDHRRHQLRAQRDLLRQPQQPVGRQLHRSGAARLHIVNDDAAPTIKVSRPAQAEGNPGTASMNFVVTLTAPNGVAAPTFRDLILTANTADGTATVANNDYVPLTNAQFTIPAGQTTLTIPVSVAGDTAVDPDEPSSLTVTPNDPTLVANAAATGQGTILNDDPTPTITITNAAPTLEGDTAGSSNVLRFQ